MAGSRPKGRVYFKLVDARPDKNAPKGTTSEILLRSYLIFDPGSIQYFVGKWVSAKPAYQKVGWHLLVFRTLRQALRFDVGPAYPDALLRVYRCVCRGVHTPPYKSTRANMGTRKFGDWPQGTVAAKQVKLLSQVTKLKRPEC